MNRYKEIGIELESWYEELSEAWDEMIDHMQWADYALEIGEADEVEIAMEEAEIMERIDAAQFWIDELEAEVAELLAA